jgi:hypothetical protein
MVEIFVEFLFELFINTVGEVLFEIGLQSFKDSAKKNGTEYPLLAFLGYSLLGAVAGGLSLLIFPQYFIRVGKYHGVGLIVIPVIAGMAMSGIGTLRKKTGKQLIRLDSFVYGFIFAFCMTLIRFLFAK